MQKLTRFLVAAALIAVVAVAGMFYWAESASAQRLVVTWAELAPAMGVQERHTDRLLAIPGVLGTAVAADALGRPIIKVYVERDGVRGIPGNLEGVTVVPQVTGPIVALKGPPGGGVDPTQRFPRPVPIGVSTGHPAITAGTIGCRVRSGNQVFALSNNHVYADENQAQINDAVIQPGTFDGGSSPADDIGNLSDFVTIVFSQSANNVVDAAIASTTTSLVGNATPSDGYGMPREAVAVPSFNDRVMKYGRTTSLTTGKVAGLNVTILVQYDTGVARFINQIEITGGNFSAGGDSGSLIVLERGGDARKPVGLLFAGGGGSTFGNPIQAVLDAFGVSVDGDPS